MAKRKRKETKAEREKRLAARRARDAARREAARIEAARIAAEREKRLAARRARDAARREAARIEAARIAAEREKRLAARRARDAARREAARHEAKRIELQHKWRDPILARWALWFRSLKHDAIQSSSWIAHRDGLTGEGIVRAHPRSISRVHAMCQAFEDYFREPFTVDPWAWISIEVLADMPPKRRAKRAPYIHRKSPEGNTEFQRGVRTSWRRNLPMTLLAARDIAKNFHEAGFRDFALVLQIASQESRP